MTRDEAVQEIASQFARSFSRSYVDLAEIAMRFADTLAMAERTACADEVPLAATAQSIRDRDTFPYAAACAAVRRTT